MTWTNQDLIVIHGTIDEHAAAVAAAPDPSYGSATTDFGLGFYVTTKRKQAASWANLKAGKAGSGVRATIIEYAIDRDWLASLETLGFVISDPVTGYWDFVSHCRSGATFTTSSGARHADHKRTGSKNYYDAVFGPVSLWQQKFIMAGCDQISFHGPSGTRLALNHIGTYHGSPTFPQ